MKPDGPLTGVVIFEIKDVPSGLEPQFVASKIPAPGESRDEPAVDSLQFSLQTEEVCAAHLPGNLDQDQARFGQFEQEA